MRPPAARRAGVHEMILRLANGYDTPLGPGATALSAGQRQRLGLARAMYGEPRLLVLDEPNANLDDAGQAALLSAVRELKANGTTVVLVTHSITEAVMLADRIVLMSPRPGRVQAIVDVKFPRPRRPALEGSVEFQAIASDLRRLLGEEA